MKTLETKKTAKIISFTLVTWGLVLSAIGFAFGNQTMSSKKLDQFYHTVKNQTITLESLYQKNGKQSSNFLMVEFSQKGFCEGSVTLSKKQRCYQIEKLNDFKWVRKSFRNLKRPVVVYSKDWDDKVQASAIMASYGYDVKMLEIYAKIPPADSATSLATALQSETDQDEMTAADVIISPVVESEGEGDNERSQSLDVPDEDEYDEEDEEEEGC